jgi:hypothetical protein
MLFVRQIIKSMGLKVKLPMILNVHNQEVCKLVKNQSIRGWTQHVATKAMFLRELKEWGLVVEKYLAGSQSALTCRPRTCHDLCLQSILVIT